MGMSIREALRQKTVGAKKEYKSKILDFDGIDVEFRQPSLKVRKKIGDRAKKNDGTFDVIDAMIWNVIYSTYVPGTNELVFEEGDYENMAEQSEGSFVTRFATEILELAAVETDVKNS